MGIFDRFRRPSDRPSDTETKTEGSPFSRPHGQIAGPFPAADDLQRALGVRLMGACHDPFNNESSRKSPLKATMWWVSIQPSFHAWSELGFVQTQRDGKLVGNRVAMVVGGCSTATACADFASMDELSFAFPEQWPCDTEGGMMFDGCAYPSELRPLRKHRHSRISTDLGQVSTVGSAVLLSR